MATYSHHNCYMQNAGLALSFAPHILVSPLFCVFAPIHSIFQSTRNHHQLALVVSTVFWTTGLSSPEEEGSRTNNDSKNCVLSEFKEFASSSRLPAASVQGDHNFTYAFSPQLVTCFFFKLCCVFVRFCYIWPSKPFNPRFIPLDFRFDAVRYVVNRTDWSRYIKIWWYILSLCFKFDMMKLRCESFYQFQSLPLNCCDRVIFRVQWTQVHHSASALF